MTVITSKTLNIRFYNACNPPRTIDYSLTGIDSESSSLVVVLYSQIPEQPRHFDGLFILNSCVVATQDDTIEEAIKSSTPPDFNGIILPPYGLVITSVDTQDDFISPLQERFPKDVIIIVNKKYPNVVFDIHPRDQARNSTIEKLGPFLAMSITP